MAFASSTPVKPALQGSTLSLIKSAAALPAAPEWAGRSSRSSPELSARSTASTTSEAADTPSSTSSRSSRSTDDTLSMITTPWTTESWSTEDEEDGAWAMRDLTSTSASPRTSPTYGASTAFNSYSKTLTIYSFRELDCESRSLRPLRSRSPSGVSSTLSSWTVESFTSAGWLSDGSSGAVRVNYPWSPFTDASFSDTYPSSLPSLNSRFLSSTTFNRDTRYPSLEVANEDTILVS